MTYRFAAIAALLLVPPLVLPQGAQRGVQMLDTPQPVRHGHHYVVAIGIDHYQNWPVLSTAVNDATGFARLLTSQFGFEYAVEPLTEKNATREAIDSLINDDLRSRLQPDDDLVFFFAGHGTTRNDRIGNQVRSVGFIVPVDARAPSADEHWSDYIDIDELLRNIASLPAAHILVILDSCHSGMALGSNVTVGRGDVRLQQDLLANVARKIITSAQGNQLAADNGPLPGHSLFTGLVMQGLTSGQADTFRQGFITATQLGAWAQHAVGAAVGSRQTPLFGAFDLDAGGELIIPLGSGTPAPSMAASAAAPGTVRGAPSPSLSALETAEIARLRSDGHQYWDKNDPTMNFPAARSGALKLCASGDQWACAQAAESFRLGKGGSDDYSRALDLARQACTARVSDACTTLAILYEHGQTILPDLPSAVRLLDDSCNQGALYSCAELGRLYSAGSGVPRDPARSRSLFSKACDGGELIACEDLAYMFAASHQDPATAVALFLKACNGGVLASCGNLGNLTLRGQGVPQNTAQGLALLQKACGGGDSVSCAYLGSAYTSGIGVAKDPAQAAAWYRKACAGGYKPACPRPPTATP